MVPLLVNLRTTQLSLKNIWCGFNTGQYSRDLFVIFNETMDKSRKFSSIKYEKVHYKFFNPTRHCAYLFFTKRQAVIRYSTADISISRTILLRVAVCTNVLLPVTQVRLVRLM